jgi:hypothetical protein
MQKTRAPQLTTVELIDALEAGIASLRSRNGRPAPPANRSIEPGVLRAQLERASASAAELAEAVGMPRGDLDAWIARLFHLLTPAARWRLLAQRPNGSPHAGPTHPFSKIEEL